MGAIELVDDRYEDYSALSAPVLIGDDFFNAGVVLGAEQTDWRDLDLKAVRGGPRRCLGIDERGAHSRRVSAPTFSAIALNKPWRARFPAHHRRSDGRTGSTTGPDSWDHRKRPLRDREPSWTHAGECVVQTVFFGIRAGHRSWFSGPSTSSPKPSRGPSRRDGDERRSGGRRTDGADADDLLTGLDSVGLQQLRGRDEPINAWTC